MTCLRMTFITLALLLAVPHRAQALLDVRVGYSNLSSSPSDLNNANTRAPAVSAQQGLVVDAIVQPFLMPIGFGLRYEDFGETSGTGSTAAGAVTSDWTRVSLVLNDRLINTLVYLGPILTFGLSSSGKYNLTVANVETDYTMGGAFTASAGVEGGLKLGFFRLGAEFGYMYAPLGNLKTSSGADATNSSGSAINVDYSGVYARALLGFGF